MGTITAPGVDTPFGRLTSLRALLLVRHLLALDDLWTVELDRVAGEPAAAVAAAEMLAELVREMEVGLERLPTAALEVRQMLDELGPEQFDANLVAFGEAAREPFDLRGQLAELLPDYEPLGATIAACDYIREQASAEAGLLVEKLEKVRAGEITPGDFLMPFRCAAYLMGIGTTVAAAGTVVVLGGPLAPTALGLVYPAINFVEDWRERGCRVELPRISRFRRA